MMPEGAAAARSVAEAIDVLPIALLSSYFLALLHSDSRDMLLRSAIYFRRSFHWLLHHHASSTIIDI